MESEINRVVEYKKPAELFASGKVVKICAPMVRYSKLPFRALVRKYDCDLTFTPMIVADSFVKSIKARDSDFTTSSDDRPLIVQFAAHNGKDFADAAEIIAPFSDGIDLNCGCPQRWAMQEGYGACLIRKPDLVSDMVKQARSRVQRSDFSVSIKIRIHKDIRETVDLCRQIEATGVSWISVHGRTKDQRAQPVDLDAIKLIRENLSIPVIANGDIRSLEDTEKVHNYTGVQGVMSARGILANPAMYAGYEHTPVSCLKDWVDLSLAHGVHMAQFHQHLIFMMEGITPKADTRVFNSLNSTCAIIDYLEEHYGI